MGGNNSDMYDAARFVQAFPEIVGNSGTATRSMGASDYVMGMPGNLLARAYLSRPVTAAAAAGAGAAGTAARLGNPITRAIGMPAGAMSGISLANLFQEK
jgi:hypothetical protein